MLALLARYWWVFALRGAVAIIFGIMALVWPLLTLQVLLILFGAYALVDGVFAVVSGITVRERNSRWWGLLLRGIAGIIIGLVTFFWPGMTALALLYFFAAWEIVTGTMEIVAGIQLRRIIENEWLLILAGAVSIIFGLVLVIFPGAGALALVWLISAYSISFGILLLVLAFRLRNVPRAPQASIGARA
ncbi:MAG: HdeD family acid-resistance protein [Chloroflexota bacterium]|nr:HdeD family acid-resistance protein [Chloroflexota bacterium]